jgi:hypothetical protein
MAAAVLMIMAFASRPAAQAPQLTAKYFFSYARAHRVTVRRNGNVVTMLDIPAGVWLSVYSDREAGVRLVETDRDAFQLTPDSGTDLEALTTLRLAWCVRMVVVRRNVMTFDPERDART